MFLEKKKKIWQSMELDFMGKLPKVYRNKVAIDLERNDKYFFINVDINSSDPCIILHFQGDTENNELYGASFRAKGTEFYDNIEISIGRDDWENIDFKKIIKTIKDIYNLTAWKKL